MKSLIMFWRMVLTEVGTWCRVSTTLDLKTVKRRVEHEGELKFFTLTLPTFGKDFERCLEEGRVLPDAFLGFKKRGKLPVFLGGFLELVFDRNTGDIIDEVEGESPPVSDAVFSIRQLTLMYGKMLIPCPPEVEAAAFESFVETDQEVADWDRNIDGGFLAAFRKDFNLLFQDILSKMDEDVYYNRLIPKHGPGSTAERILGNEKFDHFEWTQRLESVFPFGEYAIPSWRYYYRLEDVTFLAPGEERPVRVVSVPKTQKTPRIIAIEPVCMQYMQQAISQQLVSYIADSYLGDFIGFDDQLPNQQMAQRGSFSGTLATLDLSEASDRVSNLLVESAIMHYPWLSEGIAASRSTRADVLGHGVIPISKFASMGSALTFPIEAMVFLTCVFHGISTELDVPVSKELVEEFRGRVRVYGDDIIVPVEFTASVIDSLKLFGAKVNMHKSFWNGPFRESCGKEYYDGVDVSITRVRREFPRSRADVLEIISLVSLRNQLYQAGLWRSARFLDEWIEEFLPHFPTVHPESPAVGRHTVLEYETHRMSEALHSPQVKGYVVDSRIPKSPISGEGALLKCLTKKGLQPFNDVKHLERQGRPDAVYLKLRWISPF